MPASFTSDPYHQLDLSNERFHVGDHAHPCKVRYDVALAEGRERDEAVVNPYQDRNWQEYKTALCSRHEHTARVWRRQFFRCSHSEEPSILS